MQYHGYLDRFSVFGHAVYAEGWANAFDPALRYDGQPIDLQYKILKRPDLVPVFGQESNDWGFAATAMLPSAEVQHQLFQFRFNAGVAFDNPASRFSAPDDQPFRQMVANFRNAVASRKGSMLEIGSRARSGRSYRSWFPSDIRHVGIDITDGPNVDVVCDAHHLSESVEGPFDFAFSMAVFEHILMPWKVAIEMNSVLKDGALGLIVSHASWPLHEEPWDFFRFSRDSWRGIFNRHTGFEVVDAQYQYPAAIVPNYINDTNFERMSLGRTYLLSGCLIRRTGPACVAWDGRVGDVYDLGYSHA